MIDAEEKALVPILWIHSWCSQRNEKSQQRAANSQETRLRYARFLIRWFFADGLDGIARKTWVAYEDEKNLASVCCRAIPCMRARVC